MFKFIKNTESLGSFSIQIKDSWKWIFGGGSIMTTIWGGIEALSSPIVNVLGKPLSFSIGIIILCLMLIVLTKSFIFFKALLFKPSRILDNLNPPNDIFFKLKIGKDHIYTNLDATNIRNHKLLITENKRLLILFEFFCDITHDIYRFDINGYKDGDSNSIGNIFHRDVYENKSINIIEFTFKEHTFSDIDYLEIKWTKHEPKRSPGTR